ncbi:MAG: hypothetical protein ACOCRX_08410 [Candidatus Woesearchaeota archaeon]
MEQTNKMRQPLTLIIKKKTTVPTKNQIKHSFRSDWIYIGKLGHNDTARMLKYFNGSIENDAQFCYFLYQTFGSGIYLILATRKKRKGFWNFMKVELMSEGFRRLPKNKTEEDLEEQGIKRDINKKKRMLKDTDITETEKQEIKEEIDELKEEYDTTKDINKEIKQPTKAGCSPYLKSKQPMYYLHEYEDANKTEERKAEVQEFW